MIKKILTSLVLSIMFVVTVQAAIGIPSDLMPKNVPLQELNKTITQQVTTSGQDGAVTGANIVLQYMANLLLFFAAPLAVLFLARAGADYAFAMGEDSKLEGAKRELTWSILGLVLVMFAYVIVRIMMQPVVGLQSATDAALPTQINQGAEAICQQKSLETYGEKMSCAQYNEAECEFQSLSTYGTSMSCADYKAKNNSPEAIKAKTEIDAVATEAKFQEKTNATAKAMDDARAAKEAAAEAAKAAADAKPAIYETLKPGDDGIGSPLTGKPSFTPGFK